MFWNVLLLGAAAGLQPPLIAALVYMLSRSRPGRLLAVYLAGGVGISLIVGVVVLFVLKDVGVNKGSSVPAEIEIAVGALCLVIAALVASGWAGRLRDQAQARRDRRSDPEPSSAVPGPGGAAGAVEVPPAITKLAQLEKVPGLGRLAPRVQRGIASESPWVAWAAGVAIGMPTPYYLAAIAIILKSGVPAETQIAALIVFNLAAFALVIFPLMDYLRAPEATQARVERLQAWVDSHHRLVGAGVAGAIGAYLLIKGITKLG